MAPREAHPRREMDSARLRHSAIPPLRSGSGPPPQGGPPGSQGWELARPGQGRGPDGLADHFPSFPSLRAAAPSIHMVASQAPQTEELRLIDHLLPVESTSWWVAPPSFAHSFSKHVQTTRHCTRHQDNNKEEG